jgi:hypothetical protein
MLMAYHVSVDDAPMSVDLEDLNTCLHASPCRTAVAVAIGSAGSARGIQAGPSFISVVDNLSMNKRWLTRTAVFLTAIAKK